MIYITGDFHGGLEHHKLSTQLFPEQNTLTKEDYLIICGDFGCFWYEDRRDKYWLEWFEKKPFTTLFLDGNHENFDILNAFPITEWNGGKVHQVHSSVIHLMRGQVYTLEGHKIFVMGGANSIDKRLRVPGISWWEQETPNAEEMNEARSNLMREGNSVDVVLTHCAPTSIASKKLNLGTYYSDPTSDFLEEIQSTTEYKKWYFGHYHKDIEVDDKHICLYSAVVPLTFKEGINI